METTRFTLGGAVWINLVNTINKRQIDVLDDPERLMAWLMANELLRESDQKELENKETLRQITDVLHSLRNISFAILEDFQQAGLSPSSVQQLRSLTDPLKVKLTLRTSEGRIELVNEGLHTDDHITYQVLASIVHTLQIVSRDRIRACEHEDCILHFIDTSKSGKRRWCSMETCGNRHKAAEFYARKKQKE
ncbi:CGNR zinc finger domain-containing protein [Brevibacillus nitrificans]|uniref:CGNR zinc finger domain-containing protein n=1 Tax=Brevibacillus nitrificans TaxID=651560 RepID=UPI00260DA92B|nr:CGNR zinc finger domain-containing protein [Brevibacillus nitrificans]